MKGTHITEPCGESGKRKNTMPTTVPGIYKEGKIELLETPAGVPEGRVLVTVQADDKPKPAPRYLQRGKYTKGRLSTEEDFKIAEWRGENESLDD
jgi:hypothetical protein